MTAPAVPSAPPAPAAEPPRVALLTPPGPGAIAALLADGPEIFARLAPLFRLPDGGALPDLAPGRLKLARFCPSGELLDEVLLRRVRPEASETGREQLEIDSHGGALVVQALFEALAAAGLRVVRPEELWRAAVRAGRLPLLVFEARLALARAVTARQTDFLLAAPAALAAALRAPPPPSGFPPPLGEGRERERRRRGEGWGGGAPSPPAPDTKDTRAEGERERAWPSADPAGLRLLATHRVVLLGPTNAGKSLLANRLAGEERMIVSPRPGTTRDAVEFPVALRGLAVQLVDTAGATLRSTSRREEAAPREAGAPAELERLAAERTAEAARVAEMLLVVLDGAGERAAARAFAEAFPRFQPAGVPVLALLNKSDLGRDAAVARLAAELAPAPGATLEISALTGAGLDRLTEKIAELLLGGREASARLARKEALAFTRRQIGLLREGAAGGPAERRACAARILGTGALDAGLAEAAAEFGLGA